jgi:hypothetical protein
MEQHSGSFLSQSPVFFKVSDKLVLYAYVARDFLRVNNQPISNITRVHIPLLIRRLLREGIIKNEMHALVDYYWTKDI